MYYGRMRFGNTYLEVEQLRQQLVGKCESVLVDKEAHASRGVMIRVG